MRTKLNRTLALLLTSVAGSTAGQIVVEYNNGSGFNNVTSNPSYVTFPSGNGSGADLTLLDQSETGTFRVTTQNKTTQSIGTITYNGASQITLLVNAHTGITTSQGQPAALDWNGLTGSGVENVFLQARINGYLTGDVTVGKFIRIDAREGIDTGVTIRQLQSNYSITVRSEKGGVGADIVLEEGHLQRVESNGDFTGSLTIENGDLIDIFSVTGSGDLLGDIFVSGTIRTIWVQGNIGSPTQSVSIHSNKDVSSASGADRITIRYVLCRGDMYANIVASNSATNKGTFNRIRANEGVDQNGKIASGSSDTPRDFTGSIAAYEALEIEDASPFERIPCIMFNDVLGNSEIRFYSAPLSPIAISSLSSDSRILIGNELGVVSPANGTEDSMLFIGSSSGLAGQVIINQNNESGTMWPGEFGIGGTLASPTIEIKPTGGDDTAPYYTLLSDQLGGGAIGLAPFNFHQRTSAPPGGVALDCDPYQEELRVIDISDPPLMSVRIRHYGPVYADETEDGPHFRVEWKLLAHHAWQDRTSLFEVDFTATAGDEENGHRDAVITAASGNTTGFTSFGYWRIRPYADLVRCALVDGNPDVAYDSNVTGPDAGTGSPSHDWYAFRVALTSGSMMLIQNEEVTLADLAA